MKRDKYVGMDVNPRQAEGRRAKPSRSVSADKESTLSVTLTS